MSRSTRKKTIHSQLIVRIKLGGDAIFGPGKADLLERIDRLGSLSAAARAMGMSYRQAWMLLDTMNQAFRGPLVATSQGGAGGGGASLTPLGRRILVGYRRLQQKAVHCTQADLGALLRLRAADLRAGSRKRSGPQRSARQAPSD